MARSAASRPEPVWKRYFPHRQARKIQARALNLIFSGFKKMRGIVLELSTGAGKTAIGLAVLQTLRAQKAEGALYMLVPTKALANQVASRYPHTDVHVMYGKNEYPCPYYHARGVEAQADEIPCRMLVRKNMCPHYVPSLAEIPKDVEPCPYYLDQAKADESSGIIVSTTARFLITRLFFNQPQRIAGVVIDEADKIAETARTIFTYEITDYHLKKMVELLKQHDTVQAGHLNAFLQTMINIAKRKPAMEESILSVREITRLLTLLEKVSFAKVIEDIENALARGELDPIEHREDLVVFEQMARDLERYINSLLFSLKVEGVRNPLSYVCAFYRKRLTSQDKVRYKLVLHAYYVAPLIRKVLAGVDRVVAYSATIGWEDPFHFETGIHFPVHELPSPFSEKNARIYLPSDVPNLAAKQRGPDDMAIALGQMIETAHTLEQEGIRSLHVVESERERVDFRDQAMTIPIDLLTYGDDERARQTLERFQAGEGMELLGTAAQYARGVDLFDDTAEVTAFLRPGYSRPQDPGSQFEEQRFGKERAWAQRMWRVINELRQVQGRNIRSEHERGVLILFSQHFRRLRGGFPEHLKGAWVFGKTLAECVQDAIQFLQPGSKP